MFNRLLLVICFALSVVAHSVMFLLLGFHIARDVSVLPNQSSGYLKANLVQKADAPPDFVGKVDVLSGAVDLEPAELVGGGKASSVRPGVIGNVEKVPVLALSIDDYLPPSRLDRLPRLLQEVDTSIGFHGVVGVVGEAEIILLISSSGGVDDVLVLESSLPAFVVDEVVMRFRKVLFEPGKVGNWSVRSRLRIRLTPPENDELMRNPYSARQRAWK